MSSNTSSDTSLTIMTASGDQIAQWIDPVADLRIRVFREFPYLYAGDLSYERRYLQRYQQSADSVLVLARDADRVVGASTGLPMVNADTAFQAPFLAAGWDPAGLYYFGESVLLPDYRGHGIGHRFFDAREQAARAQGFVVTTFCAVVRPADHPLKPADYRPHDVFWSKRGYQCRPDLECEFPWLDLGEEQETTKAMRFWVKEW